MRQGEPMQHRETQKLRQSYQTAAAVFLRQKQPTLRTCRAGIHNPSLAVILTCASSAAAPPSQEIFPMTGFRHVRLPPRLQWRYRSGFAPDSLFSPAAWTAPGALKWLFTFVKENTTVSPFCQRKSGINPASAALFSWVKPSSSFRNIQLSTASYSSSVICRS